MEKWKEKLGKYGKYVLGAAFAVVVVVLLVGATRDRLTRKPVENPEQVVVEKEVVVEKPVAQTVVVEKEVVKEVPVEKKVAFAASPTVVVQTKIPLPTPTPLPQCPLRGKQSDGKSVTCYACYQCDANRRSCVGWAAGMQICEYRYDETKLDYYTWEQDKFLASLIWWENLAETPPLPEAPF